MNIRYNYKYQKQGFRNYGLTCLLDPSCLKLVFKPETSNVTVLTKLSDFSKKIEKKPSKNFGATPDMYVHSKMCLKIYLFWSIILLGFFYFKLFSCCPNVKDQDFLWVLLPKPPHKLHHEPTLGVYSTLGSSKIHLNFTSFDNSIFVRKQT